MAPLLVQLIVSLVAAAFVPAKDAARIGMAALFFFTGAAHFGPMKRDMAAMIPPPLGGALWLIYVTGVLEVAGAAGLLAAGLRWAATWGLMALLVALFPANAYAAMNGLRLRDRRATPIWLRGPLQLFWIGVLAWTIT